MVTMRQLVVVSHRNPCSAATLRQVARSLVGWLADGHGADGPCQVHRQCRMPTEVQTLSSC